MYLTDLCVLAFSGCDTDKLKTLATNDSQGLRAGPAAKIKITNWLSDGTCITHASHRNFGDVQPGVCAASIIAFHDKSTLQEVGFNTGQLANFDMDFDDVI